jgi:predicted nucleotidyltransferase
VTPEHRRVLAEILAELQADPGVQGVQGVLLGGSLARGTARIDSDIGSGIME